MVIFLKSFTIVLDLFLGRMCCFLMIKVSLTYLNDEKRSVDVMATGMFADLRQYCFLHPGHSICSNSCWNQWTCLSSLVCLFSVTLCINQVIIVNSKIYGHAMCRKMCRQFIEMRSRNTCAKQFVF